MTTFDNSQDSGAIFSDDRVYRYLLWRRFGSGENFMTVIGLNPSTADESADDPTIRRCSRFARDWGYSGLYMVNLFAFRATKPCALRLAATPIGPDNDNWLDLLTNQSALNLAAWGDNGLWQGRAATVTANLGRLHCLGVTCKGSPRHPLYVKAIQMPIEYQAPQP